MLFFSLKEDFYRMKKIKAIVRIIDKVINAIGNVLMFGAILIMLYIIFYAIIRHSFNPSILLLLHHIRPYSSVVIITTMYIVLAYSYGLQKGGFVSMDMFSSRWKPRTQKIVALAAYFVFFLPFCGLLLYSTCDGAISSIGEYEVVDETYWYPAWPLKFAIFIGIFLLFIQGIAEMLRNFVWLAENKRSDKK